MLNESIVYAHGSEGSQSGFTCWARCADFLPEKQHALKSHPPNRHLPNIHPTQQASLSVKCRRYGSRMPYSLFGGDPPPSLSLRLFRCGEANTPSNILKLTRTPRLTRGTSHMAAPEEHLLERDLPVYGFCCQRGLSSMRYSGLSCTITEPHNPNRDNLGVQLHYQSCILNHQCLVSSLSRLSTQIPYLRMKVYFSHTRMLRLKRH